MGLEVTPIKGIVMKHTCAHDIFLDMWDKAVKQNFHKEWKNNTGYLDGAANVKATTVLAFTDDRGRKGILVPLPKLGRCLVVFERYVGDTTLVTNGERVQNKTERGLLTCCSLLSFEEMLAIAQAASGTLRELPKHLRGYIEKEYFPESWDKVEETLEKGYRVAGWLK